MIEFILNWWRNRDSLRTFGAARSPQWSRVRKNFIDKHPFCEICGGTIQCEIHHKLPFHEHPELELDEKNLITLCSRPSHECHFVFGHLGSFQSYNPDIELDAKMWSAKILNRP